jgi:tRNA(Ile)-lysidine synthase
MQDSKKQPKSPEERALRFIRENNLAQAGELLIIGVSGGPDSVCLLNILNALKNELNIRLHVAHLNHQLRGAESQADAAFVARLADKLNIPATIESRNVTAYQKEKHLSLEEAAREVRYTFFAELAAKLGTKKVAVGHTASDQVETVLMHLIRGSGTRGLTGLQPETALRPSGNPLTVIRPILVLSRAETEAYCRTHGLTWRTDSSNLLPETMRNRIRLELLPFLRKYNPEIETAIIRMAAIARDDTGFIDAATQQLWRDIVKQSNGSITIDKTRFLTLPLALRRSLLRQVIAVLTGDLRNIKLSHIEDIMSIIGKGAGRRITLPEGLVFSTGYCEFTLQKENGLSAPYPPIEGNYRLNIPGETIIPGWRVEAEITDRDSYGGLCPDEGRLTTFFDFDKTGEELTVRERKPGDRFVPLGMIGMKTVAEFLIDDKVPRVERPYIPVVESKNQIVWLAGVRIDERVKVTENTKKVLRLKFERTDNV